MKFKLILRKYVYNLKRLKVYRFTKKSKYIVKGQNRL